MEPEDEQPSRFRGIGFAASWAGALTLLCLAVGQGAEQYAEIFAPSEAEVAAAKPRPQFNAIDYATTGAVAGQTVVLAPCATETKTK